MKVKKGTSKRKVEAKQKNISQSTDFSSFPYFSRPLDPDLDPNLNPDPDTKSRFQILNRDRQTPLNPVKDPQPW
jgi:hypothetical protein